MPRNSQKKGLLPLNVQGPVASDLDPNVKGAPSEQTHLARNKELIDTHIKNMKKINSAIHVRKYNLFTRASQNITK